LVLAGIKHTQQVSLGTFWEIRDFVQEQSAVVSRADEALPVGRAWVGVALEVPKELSGSQFGWQGCGVARNQRARAPATPMDCASRQFLSGSTFAMDEHVAVARRHQIEVSAQLPGRLALAD
jgi:hypothetical protein